MKKEILIITGNDDKFKEFKAVLISVKLKRRKLDLPELQGSPKEIVEEKARLAAKITNEPCFVDDTSLCFDAWGGLPGPYIKDFIKHMGLSKLSRTVLKSGNTKATAITSVGYCEPHQKPVCIQGIRKGKISLPKGKHGFKKGWDKIFIPDCDKRTYAQMESKEKNAISQRTLAIKAFTKFLKKKFG
jgi:inosine triphosphate pyrophosphatase